MDWTGRLDACQACLHPIQSNWQLLCDRLHTTLKPPTNPMLILPLHLRLPLIMGSYEDII